MNSKAITKPLDHPFLHDNVDLQEREWSAIDSNDNYYWNNEQITNINSEIYQEDFKFSTIPNIKPTLSQSTPSLNQYKPHNVVDPVERIQFLQEMEKAREELAEFRKNMDGLVKQMDVITVDLDKSTDRVSEIEQDLTATEEVNVNLQVLLERAVKTQKESDTFATQAIKNMYSDLASIVYENNQLQGRITLIENQQKEQRGSVHDIIKRMYEYTEMLEQAQGTIHMLQEPRLVKLNSITSSSSDSTSRRNSLISFFDDDNSSVVSSLTMNTTKRSSNNILSPVLSPQSTTPLLKPQQGLKMLFNNSSGSQLGLSSITQKK